MSNPVDEFLQSCDRVGKPMEKSAGPLSGMGQMMGGKFGDELARGAIQATMGAAVMALGGAAVKTSNAIKKRKSFRDMLEHNADLNEQHQNDPKMFGRHFESFYSMNPAFASDPVVAGTYMRQMSMNPQAAGRTLVESLEARQKGSPWELGMTGVGPTVKYKF